MAKPKKTKMFSDDEIIRTAFGSLDRLCICEESREWIYEQTDLRDPMDLWLRCNRGDWLALVCYRLLGMRHESGMALRYDLVERFVRRMAALRVRYNNRRHNPGQSAEYYAKTWLGYNGSKNYYDGLQDFILQETFGWAINIEASATLNNDVAILIRRYFTVRRSVVGGHLQLMFRTPYVICSECGQRNVRKQIPNTPVLCLQCYNFQRGYSCEQYGPCKDCGKRTYSSIRVCKNCQNSRKAKAVNIPWPVASTVTSTHTATGKRHITIGPVTRKIVEDKSEYTAGEPANDVVLTPRGTSHAG